MLDDDTLVGEEMTSSGLSEPSDEPRARPARARPFERGDAIGRYVTLDRLGAGGMGTVYAAYDPELDRKVAVKLLHAEPGSRAASESQHRLRREAQAMAKLAHQNVVQVFDVGEVDGRVFVAMEFIDGATLGQRMEEEGAQWRRSLELCLQAGRGLAAAHAAGLVHRDFKPDNVMIDPEGRVVVMDFGLARAAVREATIDERLEDTRDGEKTPVRAIAGLPEKSLTSVVLTQQGELLGSPAYMAPEQFLGAETDARTDQFAFCLVVWELLAGERPFGGESVPARAFAVTTGKLKDPPSGSPVPGRVWRTLQRGLAPKPEQRWPDMGALLDELERDPAAAWRRQLGWVVPTALAGGLGAALWLQPAPPSGPEPCTGASSELEKVWDDDARTTLRSEFAAIELPFAADTAQRVVTRLDTYAQGWADAHRQACLAHARNEQSDELLDLRMGCLDRRRAALGELVRLLESPDENTVQQAVKAVSSLPRVDRCNDVQALTARLPPPEDEAVARQVDEAHADLARAQARFDTADYERTRAIVEPLGERATAIGHEPLQAEVFLLLGQTLTQLGEYEQAEKALLDAYHFAVSSGADEVAVRAAAAAALDVGYFQGKEIEGLPWARHARSLLPRTGSPKDLEALVLNSFGVLHFVRGEYDEAVAAHQRAKVLRIESMGADHPQVAFSSSNLATVAYQRGDYPAAIEAFEGGIEVLEASLGPDHSSVATLLTNLGSARQKNGDLVGASADQKRALGIWERALGPDHPDVAYALNNLANVEHDAQDFQSALEHHERALAIRKDHFGENHPMVASSVGNLAMVHTSMQDHAKARSLFEQALAINTEVYGAEHPETLVVRSNLGTLLLDAGELDAAAEHLQFTLAAREKALGEDSVTLVPTLIVLIALERGRKDFEAARARGARARELAAAGLEPDHPDHAEIDYELGMVELRAGRTDEARILLERARERIEVLPTGHRLKKPLAEALAALDAG